jgi:hypothetical protein
MNITAYAFIRYIFITHMLQNFSFSASYKELQLQNKLSVQKLTVTY